MEDLGGDERKETVINIYICCMKKLFLIKQH